MACTSRSRATASPSASTSCRSWIARKYRRSRFMYTINGSLVGAIGTPSYNVNVANESLSQGQPIYKDASNSDRLCLSDANAAGKDKCDGLAMASVTANQPCPWLGSGSSINFGGNVGTQGDIVCVSNT